MTPPEETTPQILVPDSPDFSWQGVSNSGNSPVFDSSTCWGSPVPWTCSESVEWKYATTGTDNSYLLGSGEPWSYTGLMIRGGNSIYVTQSLSIAELGGRFLADSYIQDGASLNVSSNATFTMGVANRPLTVGRGSVGTLNVDSGTVSINGSLNVGTGAAGDGYVYLSSGEMSVKGVTISSSETTSKGAVVMTDGTFANTGAFIIGYAASETTAGGGNGSFTQTGGTFNHSGGEFSIAKGMNSSGYFVFTNGTIEATTFNAGFGSSATVYQYGGDITASNYFCVANKGADNNFSVYHQYGGTVSSGNLFIGHKRTAEYNLYDGATINVLAGSAGLSVGDEGGTASFNMYGGTINAQGHIMVGRDFNATTRGTGSFQFLGGTIAAQGDFSINSLSSLNIMPGLDGAGTIDVAGTLTQNGAITLNLDHGLGCWTLGLDETIDVLKIGAGAEPTITNNTPLLTTSWASNTLTLSVVPDVANGRVSAGGVEFASGGESGILQIDAFGSTPLLFELEGVDDLGLFIDWLNENNWIEASEYSDDTVMISSLGLDGFDERYLLWDFSDYNAIYGAAVTLAGVSAETVPEPSSWALLFLAVVGACGVCRMRKRTM
ncbi:MAG: PEP-CTERM sorting domain-containing protein [Planctomycetia bacterium]|nr:PEP-CTERM sorting domain-containing protein [Planctomycetia bacterium]